MDEDFLTYKEFDLWYRGELKATLPDYDIMSPQQIHYSLPKLTSQEVKEISSQLYNIIELNEKIFYVYEPRQETFASRWNPNRKRLEIVFPTITKYLMRYKPVAKVAIQHELGHIVNKDSFSSHPQGHNQCINICMDIRINATLNRELLGQLTQVVFGIGNSKIEFGKGIPLPETTLVDMGLSPDSFEVFSYIAIHNMWHSLKGDNMIDVLGGLEAMELPPMPTGATDTQEKKQPKWVSIVGEKAIIIHDSSKGDFCEVKEEVKTAQGIVYKLFNFDKNELQTWYGDSFVTEGDFIEFENNGKLYIGTVGKIEKSGVTIIDEQLK